MADKPSLLVLSPRYPYPLISGDRVRIHYICRELSSHFDITLLCLCDSRQDLRDSLPKDAPSMRVEKVWLPRYRSYLNVLGAVLSRNSLQVAYYRSRTFGQRVRDLVQQHDIVLAHLLRTASYVATVAKPRALEMTDAVSLTYQRASRVGSRRRLKTWAYSVEQSRAQRYERNVLQRFDVVTVVSQSDRDQLLAGGPAAHVMVCSNGVDTDKYRFRPGFADEPLVVFLGNLTTLPNLDACTYFAREVLPLLRATRRWKFRVIGRIRPADARALAEVEGVEVTGEVANVADAVYGAHAGVCPMRIGSGVQNKVLEYMALGAPTVTSPLSLQGISATPEKEILVADEPQAYVHQLERLFGDRILAMRIASAAREYVVTKHSWRAHLAPLTTRLLELVGRER